MSTMARRAWFCGVCAALLLLGAQCAWRSVREPVVDRSASVQEAGGFVPDRASPSTRAVLRQQLDPVQAPSAMAPSSSSALPALPLIGTPLHSYFDELVRRAEQGDALAALRLHEEVSSCRVERSLDGRNSLDIPPRMQPGSNRAGFEKLLEAWRHERLHACVRRTVCAGMAPEQLADPDRWLWRAAELGAPRARVAFASGQQFHRAQSLASFDYLDRWRQNAALWLEQAVAEGDPRAISLMARTLSLPPGFRGSVLNELLGSDRPRAYALWHALSLAPGIGADDQVRSGLQAAAGGLDTRQLRNARQQGRALYKRHRRRLDAAVPADMRFNSLRRTRAELDLAPAAASCRQQLAIAEQAAAAAPAEH